MSKDVKEKNEVKNKAAKKEEPKKDEVAKVDNKDAAENKDSEKKEKEVKLPKKTKAEINKEIRENIIKNEKTVSRKDRNRAEKSARRDAKEARKTANVVEKNKSRLSNGLLAIMIFGVLFLMFASVWAYNYFSKEASIESYLEKNGGKAAYGSIQIDENSTASITADRNKMKININVSSKDNIDKNAKYYKGKKGVNEMKYISSYFLTMIKPQVRGISGSAECIVKIDKKKVNAITVKYKEAKKLMEKYGIDPSQTTNTTTSTDTTGATTHQ